MRLGAWFVLAGLGLGVISAMIARSFDSATIMVALAYIMVGQEEGK